MSEDSINFKKLAKAAGVKSLSMLPLKDLTKITGYVKGGCSPFAMKKLFPTFVDEKCKKCRNNCGISWKSWSSSRSKTRSFRAIYRCSSSRFQS